MFVFATAKAISPGRRGLTGPRSRQALANAKDIKDTKDHNDDKDDSQVACFSVSLLSLWSLMSLMSLAFDSCYSPASALQSRPIRRYSAASSGFPRFAKPVSRIRAFSMISRAVARR